MTDPVANAPSLHPLRVFARAYRTELLLFAATFFIFAAFSAQRFWRQSAAPHFVYQAQAWLEGRGDIDAQVLPNYEDWACVREVAGEKVRCEGALRPGDRWHSSFPWFPSVVMLPFVAVNGYQLNDTSFGVIVGALAVALFFSLLRVLKELEGTQSSVADDTVTAALLAFGTLFFYAAIRGEVWFSAEVMGVGLTALYLRCALQARRPLLAGLFWSMAVLTRAPLLFTGVFFVLEVVAPRRGGRLQQVRDFFKKPDWRPLLRFAAGAAPLGLLAALYNHARFGRFTEFGHRFFYNNRVNADIDQYGLFHPHFLARNLDAALLKLPLVKNGLFYDDWGLSLFITLPLLALCFVPAAAPKRVWQGLGAMLALLAASAFFPPRSFPVGDRDVALWLVLALVAAFFCWVTWQWVRSEHAPRLLVPVLLTLLCCMLPGLFYQNTGRSQFGFRFSIDYTPYLMVLIPLGGWSWKKAGPLALACASVLVNFWGAVGFRGYTEYVRKW